MLTNNAKNYIADFQTPPEIAEYMASLVPDGCISVLEPTPGIGNLVRALKKYEVVAPKDFFLLEKKRFDCVVMNPPFSFKYAIIDNAPIHLVNNGMRFGYWMLLECMKMSDTVIALMPWFTISDSDVRLRQLKKYGLKRITALPRRTFQYARIQTVVLELHRGYKGETIFEVYDTIDSDKTDEDINLFTIQ